MENVFILHFLNNFTHKEMMQKHKKIIRMLLFIGLKYKLLQIVSFFIKASNQK